MCLCACAKNPETPGPSAPTAPTADVELPKDRMAGSKVFDALGHELSCAPPGKACKPSDEPADFRDACKLAGFRVMKCGCNMVCTGNFKREKTAYDAENNEKACVAEQKDCTPPETSAAFQDACTESGHPFVVCGCEWLCGGKLKRPVSKTPNE